MKFALNDTAIILNDTTAVFHNDTVTLDAASHGEALVGVLFGIAGTISMSIALSMWKISNNTERSKRLFRRKYLWLGAIFGILFNSVLDTVAFSMAPLALIAPLQGLTIALTVLFARVGLAGPREAVSAVQWAGVALSVVGLTLCTLTGPQQDAELELWPLIRHYQNPQFYGFYLATLGGALSLLIVLTTPLRGRLLPPQGTIRLSMLLSLFAGCLGGITQTQLKVFSHFARALSVSGLGTHDTEESCRHSYEGFCIHNITAGHCCPDSFLGFCAAAGAFDVICEAATRIGGLTLESWTIHCPLDATRAPVAPSRC